MKLASWIAYPKCFTAIPVSNFTHIPFLLCLYYALMSSPFPKDHDSSNRDYWKLIITYVSKPRVFC